MPGQAAAKREPIDRQSPQLTTYVELAIRLAVLGLILYWAAVLLRPFIAIVLWSAVLTVALYPVFSWTADRLGGRRGLAAALITIVGLVIVVGPATWFGVGLVENVKSLAEKISSGDLAVPAPWDSVKTWPVIGEQVYQFWDLASTNLKEALRKLLPELKSMSSDLLSIAGSAGSGILKFFLSVVIAGFLFAPAPRIVEGVKEFSRRIHTGRGEEFVQLAGATIRSVSRGVIGISLLQALLAGIGFAIAGVPGASLLTLGVLVLGILQIGPAILILPVIIWCWTVMDTVPALIFTVYMVAVSVLDNVLRPLVLGRGLTTPMLVILAGVIGGTLAHGIIGLFIGPIVLAVVWELLVAWVRDDETDAAAKEPSR